MQTFLFNFLLLHTTYFHHALNGITKDPQSSRQLYQRICGLWKQRWYDSIVEKAEAYKPKQRITYKLIKEYILEKYSFKIHTAYIAEVKRGLGLPMYDAPNAVETLKQPRKHPTPIQVAAIKDALTYFEVIQN